MYLCMKEPYLQVSGTDALSGTGGMWHLVGRETIEDRKKQNKGRGLVAQSWGHIQSSVKKTSLSKPVAGEVEEEEEDEEEEDEKSSDREQRYVPPTNQKILRLLSWTG